MMRGGNKNARVMDEVTEGREKAKMINKESI